MAPRHLANASAPHPRLQSALPQVTYMTTYTGCRMAETVHMCNTAVKPPGLSVALASTSHAFNAQPLIFASLNPVW